LNYFELAFLQLHPVKSSCKLITIRLSYKRNIKSTFFMKHRVDCKFLQWTKKQTDRQSAVLYYLLKSDIMGIGTTVITW